MFARDSIRSTSPFSCPSRAAPMVCEGTKEFEGWPGTKETTSLSADCALRAGRRNGVMSKVNSNTAPREVRPDLLSRKYESKYTGISKVEHIESGSRRSLSPVLYPAGSV